MNTVNLNQDIAQLNAQCKDVLKSAICTVEFTKADGSERLMECTLLASELPVVPETHTKTATKQRKELPLNIIPVYDVEAKGWRSINLNTVKSFIQN